MEFVVKNKYIPIGKSKWNTIFGILEENQWKNIYKNNFSNIKNTKFQWFQYRINQNILATNKYLFKIKILDSPLCTFCNVEEETIIHILWECEKVQEFFSEIENWLRRYNINLYFNKLSFVLSPNQSKNEAFNTILLALKYYIYKTRCLKKRLTINAFHNVIIDTYHIQKHIALRRDKFDKFTTDWCDWLPLIQ